MFTLTSIYATFYILILLSILIIIFSSNIFNLLSTLSLGNLILLIQKYKTSKTMYLWLFFSLTGLPPFGLFFIKFNILFHILVNTHFGSVLVSFFFFFLNMLFYSQIFSYKNHKTNLYHIVCPDIFNYFKNTKLTYPKFSSHITYSINLFAINLLFFLFFTSLLFNDLFLILNLFNCQQ